MIPESRVLEIAELHLPKVTTNAQAIDFAAAIEREIAGSGEAVAWMVRHYYGKDEYTTELVMSPLTDDTYMDEGDEAWPLYTHPAQQEIAGSGEAPVAQYEGVEMSRYTISWLNSPPLTMDKLKDIYDPIDPWPHIPVGTKFYLHPALCEKCAELEQALKIVQKDCYNLAEKVIPNIKADAEAKCAQIEAETIEKCAKACECYGIEVGDKFYPTCSRECATALRALKPAGEQK